MSNLNIARKKVNYLIVLLYYYNNIEYWKEQTKNKKLKLLKEKICIRKIQRQWRKYWYDFYRYEIINGQNIGFCRFIEKSYLYHNQ